MLVRFSGHKKYDHTLDEQHYDSSVAYMLKPIMAIAAPRRTTKRPMVYMERS